ATLERAVRLLQGGGHDLAGQIEVLTQVINALVGQEPVIVPPGEALGHQLLGLEALHELDNLQVGHTGYLRVLLKVEVLLGLKDTLLKEVLVHLPAVLLWNKHYCCWPENKKRQPPIGVGTSLLRVDSRSTRLPLHTCGVRRVL
ncbi:hypothetical protein Vafri_11292, partial [Volvox africanus]